MENKTPERYYNDLTQIVFVVKILFSPLFKKVLSFVTFSLIVIFIFGLVNIEYSALGISEPLFAITEQVIIIFDIIFWVIVGLLTLELLIAYLKIRNAKSFVKKYWLEIIMLVLMPVFVGFKILKVSLKIIKQVKIGKTVFKLFQKMKKD
ncbi:hypothetical protein [Nitrosarchaeum koreense]|uniref:Uncharacterized protein n=1 Tax=Nitrosarchaeum koreense MY1 TaxID=1001994 RepID=F9CW51_9ARCH|nr:hypothetical protein [Nitrosarchaeum koreense]EGP93503.1 hypothetical protein MY1_0741 [Nitrosarchaeum koreense MY1]